MSTYLLTYWTLFDHLVDYNSTSLIRSCPSCHTPLASYISRKRRCFTLGVMSSTGRLRGSALLWTAMKFALVSVFPFWEDLFQGGWLFSWCDGLRHIIKASCFWPVTMIMHNLMPYPVTAFQSQNEFAELWNSVSNLFTSGYGRYSCWFKLLYRLWLSGGKLRSRGQHSWAILLCPHVTGLHQDRKVFVPYLWRHAFLVYDGMSWFFLTLTLAWRWLYYFSFVTAWPAGF